MEFIGLYKFINKKGLALMNHKLGGKIMGDSTSYSKLWVTQLDTHTH